MSLNPIVINISRVSTVTSPDYLRRVAFASNGYSTLQKGEYQLVTKENYQSFLKNESETNELAIWLKSFFVTANWKSAVIIEVGRGGNVEEDIKSLQTFIESGTYPVRHISLPSSMYMSNSLASFLQNYSNFNQAVYFSANLQADTPPSGNANFNSWRGQKSFMGVYPSLSSPAYSTDGAIAGIIASSAYDLTPINIMSPLYLKQIDLNVKNVGTTILSDIQTSNATVVQPLGGSNVVLNDVMADGISWSFYYGVDYVKTIVQNNLLSLLINSSNNVGAAIQYNSSGIETLRQNIITSLQTLKKLGVVNTFAKKYDFGKKEWSGIDDIGSIPFRVYQTSNPSDYENGIYNGFSVYVEIMGFIKQIVLNMSVK